MDQCCSAPGVDNDLGGIVELRNSQESRNTNTDVTAQIQDKNQQFSSVAISKQLPPIPEPSDELESVHLSTLAKAENLTLCCKDPPTLSETLRSFALLLLSTGTPTMTNAKTEHDLIITKIYRAVELTILHEHNEARKLLHAAEIVASKYAEDETLVRLAVYRGQSLLALMGGNTDELHRLVHRTVRSLRPSLHPGMATQVGWVYLHKALSPTTLKDKTNWLDRACQLFQRDVKVLMEARRGREITNACARILKEERRHPTTAATHIYTDNVLGHFYERLAAHPVHSIDASLWIRNLLNT